MYIIVCVIACVRACVRACVCVCHALHENIIDVVWLRHLFDKPFEFIMALFRLSIATHDVCLPEIATGL